MERTRKLCISCVCRRQTWWYNRGMKSVTRKIQDKLWEHCKRITREKYKNQDGSFNCFTCGRRIDSPSSAQTGHFIPSSICGAYLRYDLRNLRIQCYHCNINLGGSGATYYKNLVAEVGQVAVDQLFKDKQKIVKALEHYQKLLKEYEAFL